MNKGFTLIETLMYTALLSTLMIGVFSSVYVVIASEQVRSNTNDMDNQLLLQNYH